MYLVFRYPKSAMKKLLNKSIATVALMGLAYYLYNPQKYNRMAGKVKDAAKAPLKKGKEALS